MRNLVYKVGPKTSDLPSAGHILSILVAPCHSAKTLLFTTFLPHWHPRSTPRGQYWPSWVPPCQLHFNSKSRLNPIWHHMSNIWSLMTPEKATTSLKCQQMPFPSHKVPRIMGAKAKRAPVCSENLIAIKLKGLAAPGEALKNNLPNCMHVWGKR